MALECFMVFHFTIILDYISKLFQTTTKRYTFICNKIKNKNYDVNISSLLSQPLIYQDEQAVKKRKWFILVP